MPSANSTIPFPGGLPHVAVILLWYPLFTQPFIFRDVEALKARLPVHVYCLYGRNTRHCSAEMLAVEGTATTHGVKKLPAILVGAGRSLLRHPRLTLKAARLALCHRWKSLETFGENLWAFLCGLHLARHMKEAGWDLLYAPWPRGTCTAARTISVMTGIPYATSARGDNLNPADPDLAGKLRDAAFIRANNAADVERIAALTDEETRARVRLVYNSLTLPRGELCPVTMASPVRLLAVGRFDVTKGFDDLLRALAILRGQGRAVTLSLVGGGGKALGLGPMDKVINELRTSLRLEDAVSLPGIVSHDALPGLLRSHDIFVAPCVVAEDGRRDGIPNTVIEALSFGMPVVATRVNALPEVVRDGETGLLVEQKDPESLAGAIARLMDHPGEARRLGANAAALAADMFSPGGNGDRLAALFTEAFARRRPCAG